MIKFFFIKLLFFSLYLNTSYGLENNMNKIDLSTYNWSKRLLVINSSLKEIETTTHIHNWLDSNKCKIDERNIKIIFFIDHKHKRHKRPLFLKKYGFWLIGYDGEVKAFSLDTNFLNKIFNLIDQMPIRQQEMLMKKTKC